MKRASDACSNPVDITPVNLPVGTMIICDCGRCPEPDPTPAELQRQVDDAAWQAAANVDERSGT